MANNYDFMFKFIIIGDSSKSDFMKVLGNHAYCLDLQKEDSKQITNQHLEYSLAQGILPSTIILSRFKFGIQYYVL